MTVSQDFNFPNLLFKKSPPKTSDEKIGTIYVPYFFLKIAKKMKFAQNEKKAPHMKKKFHKILF